MTREEWLKLYDELVAIYAGQKDVLEMSPSGRALARGMGLLGKDRNGNTTLNKTGKTLFGSKP